MEDPRSRKTEGSNKEKSSAPKHNKRLNPVVYTRHLSSALTLTSLKFYKDHPDLLFKTYPGLDVNDIHIFSNGFARNINVMKRIEELVESQSIHHQFAHSAYFELIRSAVHESLLLQHQAMTTGLPHPDRNRLNQLVEHLSEDQKIISAFYKKVHILNIHYEIQQAAEKKDHHFAVPSLPNMEFHKDLVLIKNFDNFNLIVPYNVLLCVLDKVEAKFAYFLYLGIMSRSPTKQNIEYGKLIQDVYNICDTAYTQLGNIATQLTKTLDPLALGFCLSNFRQETNDHAFLPSLIADVLSEYPKLEFYIDQILDLYHQYTRKYGEESVKIILEMYGQEKLHFYPIVSPEEGLLKMYRYGTAHRSPDLKKCLKISGDFKRMYTCSYYASEGVLPKAYITEELDDRIKDIWSSGNPGSIDHCARISSEEWDKLHFQQHLEFNSFPENLELLDDKGICPHRKDIYILFAADAMQVLGMARQGNPAHTRLIQEMLSREVIDIREFYQTVEALGYIPPEWAVIRLMPKERELKIAARDFSILTFECRMMASACERNLSDSIFKYFSEQSMTKTGLELRHTLQSLITLPNDEESTWVTFNLDLEQWNYTFRGALQYPLTAVLNEIFGVSYFSVIPQIFTDSVLFSSEAYTPPGTPGQFLYWDTHAGGNQGIAQKFWTLITIIKIKDIMSKLDLEYRMTGAGDNQVLKIRIPNNLLDTNIVRDIKNKLAAGFQEIGLGLKMSETWYSSELFNYQRKYYMRGSALSNGLKQVLRSFAGGSDINAGLNQTIMTAMNGGVSLCTHTAELFVGPIFALTEGLVHVRYNPAFSKYTITNPISLAVLTLMGTELGLLPFLQLPSFGYSGHQDKLSESLGLLKFAWNNRPRWRRALESILIFVRGDNTPTALNQLILDPQSLNVRKPPSSESLIKNKVEDFLCKGRYVQNIQLKKLFSMYSPEAQEKYLTSLRNIVPFDARMLHTLYSNSTHGTVAATVGKFNKLSSIVKLITSEQYKTKDKSLTQEILDRDIAIIRYINHRFSMQASSRQTFEEQVMQDDFSTFELYCNTHQFATACVFSLRLFLISWSYYQDEERILGPYTPPPMCQLTFSFDSVDLSDGNYLIVTPSKDIPNNIGSVERLRGPFKMMIGSNTANPVRVLKLTQLEGSNKGTSVKEYLKVLGWARATHSHDRFIQFIEDEICIKIPEFRELLPYLIPGVAGGTYEHRMTTQGETIGAGLNSDSHISTWYQISSNRAHILCRGSEDRYVFFQQLYQYIFCSLRQSIPSTSRVFVKVALDHCSYPTVTPQFDINDPGIPPSCSSIPELKFTPEQTKLITREANYRKLLLEGNLLNSVPSDLLLASYTGYLVGTKGYRYLLEGDADKHERLGDSLVQTSINVSNIRNVPLAMVLGSVIVQLAITGVFGYVRSPSHLKIKIDSLNCIGYPAQVISPYRDLINALITGEKIHELLKLANTNWTWNGGVSIVSVLPVLFAAFSNVVSLFIQGKLDIVLIEEVKHPNHSFVRLKNFCRNWSRLFNRMCSSYKSTKPEIMIQFFNRESKNFKILLVPDVEMCLERGRTRMKIEKPIYSPYKGELTEFPMSVLRTQSPKGFALQLDILIMPIYHVAQDSSFLYSEWEQLRNKVNHNFHRILKWDNQSTGAKYKLLNILCEYGLEKENYGLIVSLAEGNGSYLSSLMHIFGNAHGFYNSLLPMENYPISMAHLYTPPELVCKCDITNRLINHKDITPKLGDLTDPITWVDIKTKLMKYYGTKTILTFDMERIDVNKDTAIREMGNFIREFEIDTVIIKMFVQEFMSTMIYSYEEIASRYKMVHIVKPLNSNLGSGEIYLVCKDFTGMSNNIVLNNLRPILDGLISTLKRYFSGGLNIQLYNHIDWNTGIFPCQSLVYSLFKEHWSGIRGLSLLVGKLIKLSFNFWYSPSSKYTVFERPTQTMIRSRTQASETFTNELNNLLASVIVYLEVINPYLSLLTPLEIKENLESNFHLILSPDLADRLNIDRSVSTTKFLKYIGYSIWGSSELDRDMDFKMLKLLYSMRESLDFHFKAKNNINKIMNLYESIACSFTELGYELGNNLLTRMEIYNPLDKFFFSCARYLLVSGFELVCSNESDEVFLSLYPFRSQLDLGGTYQINFIQAYINDAFRSIINLNEYVIIMHNCDLRFLNKTHKLRLEHHVELDDKIFYISLYQRN